METSVENPYGEGLFLCAYDPNTDEYSDEYPVAPLLGTQKTGKNYQVTPLSALPVAVNDQVTLRIDSGGFSGIDFVTQFGNVTTPLADTIRILVEEVGEVDAGTLQTTLNRLDSGRMGWSISEASCGGPTNNPDLNEPFKDTSFSIWYDFDFTTESGPASSSYGYYQNPELVSTTFIVASWVVVSQETGQRYRLQYVSSDIDFVTNPGVTTTELTGSVKSVNGSEITLRLTELPSDIDWDPIAGDIADMAVGSHILYAADAFSGQFDPEYTQLLPNNFTFQFTTPSGGGA